MPSLNKSMCLAAITSCVIGTYCAELSAQKPAGRATLGPAAKVAGVPAPVPQNGRPAQGVVRQQLPQAKPMRIPKLDPVMEDILVEWEEKSAKIKRLEGTFIRTTYDSVFEVELVSNGMYCFEFPDRGSFHQTGTVPKVEGQKGHRFVQKPGPDERWVCDGKTILKIDDKSKQYESVPIPPEDQGQNIRNSPLPFLFGMKAIEAKQRYEFELNTAKTNENTIWLKVYPQDPKDLANYKIAEVILNRSNCLPMAVKLHDNSGKKEDVYLFDQRSMTVNGRTWKRFLTGADPLKPDLKSFKRVLQPENASAPAGRQLAQPPSGRRTTGIQSPGTKTQGPQLQRTAQRTDDDEPPARSTTRNRVQP